MADPYGLDPEDQEIWDFANNATDAELEALSDSEIASLESRLERISTIKAQPSSVEEQPNQDVLTSLMQESSPVRFGDTAEAGQYVEALSLPADAPGGVSDPLMRASLMEEYDRLARPSEIEDAKAAFATTGRPALEAGLTALMPQVQAARLAPHVGRFASALKPGVKTRALERAVNAGQFAGGAEAVRSGSELLGASDATTLGEKLDRTTTEALTGFGAGTVLEEGVAGLNALTNQPKNIMEFLGFSLKGKKSEKMMDEIASVQRRARGGDPIAQDILEQSTKAQASERASAHLDDIGEEIGALQSAKAKETVSLKKLLDDPRYKETLEVAQGKKTVGKDSRAAARKAIEEIHETFNLPIGKKNIDKFDSKDIPDTPVDLQTRWGVRRDIDENKLIKEFEKGGKIEKRNLYFGKIANIFRDDINSIKEIGDANKRYKEVVGIAGMYKQSLRESPSFLKSLKNVDVTKPIKPIVAAAEYPSRALAQELSDSPIARAVTDPRFAQNAPELAAAAEPTISEYAPQASDAMLEALIGRFLKEKQ